MRPALKEHFLTKNSQKFVLILLISKNLGGLNRLSSEDRYSTSKLP